MADILLIYPKTGHDIRRVSVTAPLSILTIAATLVESYQVQILDQRTEDDFWKKLDTALLKKPILAGMGTMTGTQIYYSLEISKFIRERSSVPVVWGGMHPTIYGAQTIAKPYIDYVIRGEGEYPLLQLAQTLEKKSNGFDEVSGLLWKNGKEIFGTPIPEPIDLDLLPKIPWHLVSVEEYTSPSQYMYPGVSRVLPYQGSRGCPFKCTFCSEPALTKKFRLMKPEKMVEESLEMVKKYKVDHIAFYDEEFFVNRKWATQVASLINGQFSWSAQTRAADLLRVDLKYMEKCGLTMVAPGLESGSDRMLKYMKKGEKVVEYREANRRLSETKISTQYNFIVGFPTETKKEVSESVDLTLHLLETNPHATVNQFSPLTPLPGTELLKQVIKDHGFKEPERLEDWIQVTRGKQERSWFTRSQLRLIRFLYYSSLFLCTERHASKFGIPKFIWKTYGRFVRLRWKLKLYRLDWEIPILRMVFRYKVNPIDYVLPPTYGDSFSASESKIKMIYRTMRHDEKLPAKRVALIGKDPMLPKPVQLG